MLVYTKNEVLARQEREPTILIQVPGGQKASVQSLLQLIFQNRKTSVGNVESQTRTELSRHY